jgi:hypothetical protein
MIELRVTDYLDIVGQLERLICLCRRDHSLEGQQEIRSLLETMVEILREKSSVLRLSPAMHSNFESLENRAKEDSFAVLLSLTGAVEQAFIAELKSHLFLCLNPSEGKRWKKAEAFFENDALATFPDAQRDMAAAMRCSALNEWTACVFHLMRVLEHGLRQMATRFTVSFEVDSWHKVIKGIEDGISSLRNKQGLTDQDRKEITYYSDAASQFRHFKDAWRNHVSHSREHYDERDAEKVLAHVSEFMRHLATPV